MYTTKVGNLKRAKEVVDMLDGIDKAFWTWRCYEFEIDYYIASAELDKADKVSDAFIHNVPYDERGYRSKAEVQRMLMPGERGVEYAVKVLQGTLASGINCPQCANMLGELMLEQGQYDEAIKCFERTICETAQEQPSVNVAYAYFNLATACDRGLFLARSNQEGEAAERKYASDAIEGYWMAPETVFQEDGSIIARSRETGVGEDTDYQDLL